MNNVATESVIRRFRQESGNTPFSQTRARKSSARNLTATENEALAALRGKDAALADEIEELWKKGRSYSRLEHISDRQMCRIINGLNGVGVDVLLTIQSADREIGAKEATGWN